MSSYPPQELPSVLIVDDAPDNLRLLKNMLKGEGYGVRVAPSGSFALKSIQSMPPDLVLLDIRMPGMDGLEVCRRLKENDLTRDIPVIFITALTSMEDERRGLNLGAMDYITKPFSPDIVRARVRNFLRYAHQQKLLAQLANLDALTEISNRRGFDEAFAKEWRRASRAGEPLSILMADVDFFKSYNDVCGHPSGDRALIAIAGRMSGCLKRSGDIVARYGGEEFVALFPATEACGAKSLGEQMRQSVEQLNLLYGSVKDQRRLTMSLGGASIIPVPGCAPNVLLEQADKALYKAKRIGRNTLVWADA